MSVPAIHSAWCPRCREQSPFDRDGRCLFCDAQTGGAAPAPELSGRYSNAGKPYLMDEEVLLEARTLYAGGLSIRAVARELHRRTAYRSVASLRAALETQFPSAGLAFAHAARRDRRAQLPARPGP